MSRKTSRPTARPARGRRKAPAPPPAVPPLAERAARSLEAMRRRDVPFEHALLEDALDLHATLRTVVSAFVPGFADWCFVDLVDAAGVPRRIEVAHAEARDAGAAQAYREIALGPGWATPAAQAIRDRSPRVYAPLSEELMGWATWDARHLAALRATRPNSLMALPLVARGAAVGALTLIRSGASPAFGGEDLRRATALAAPAALAIDVARRFEAASAPRAKPRKRTRR